jgi:iron complex outermembrane recepter protein
LNKHRIFKMKKYLLYFCSILFPVSSLFAQENLVKGKVFDSETNTPLLGASIFVSGTTGTATDGNGEFSLACSDSMEITVSYLSYETQKKKVPNCGEQLLIGLVPSHIHLDEVEITATSNANKAILYQPVSIVKLNETELKRGNGLFLDDAINANVPGVYMERRTVSAGQQLNIRGYGNGARGTNGVNSNFDGQGTKVYLNNIPITDAEGITLMDDIDFGSVSNVEVTKGPAGSLYGLAIAGVVNLQTKKAEKGKTSIGQDVMIGDYGLKRYTTRLEIGGERSSLLVNYGKQNSDGFMAHTASSKDFVNVLGDFQPNKRQSITIYFGYSNSYDQRGGELTIDQYNTKDYSGNPAYIKNNAHSEVISFRAGIGHTYKLTENIANTTSVFGTGLTSNVSSAGGWTDKNPVNFGLRSTFDTKFALGKSLNLSGITGIEAQRQYAQILGYPMVLDSTNPTGYNKIGTLRSNQATISTTMSVFSEWTLTMPYEFSLTAGLGLSTMNIELNDRFFVATNNKPNNTTLTKYQANYDGMVSPRLALNKVFSKQLSVYASYSKGYKAPVSSYIFVPAINQVNTSLKPEVGNQFEIGTKGALLNDRLHYEVAVFNAIFSNKMTTVAVPNPSNTATLYTYMANGGSQDNKGVEVLVKYTAYQSDNGFLKSVRPFANFAYSDFKYVNFKYQSVVKNAVSEVDYSGNAVAGVPPITANVGIDLTTKLGLYANVNYNYHDAMYFTSDRLNKTSSYSLVNSKLGFHRTFAKHFDVNAYVGANNMTSTQYYYMVFLNQLPDAYMPAPYNINYFGGLNLKYIF